MIPIDLLVAAVDLHRSFTAREVTMQSYRTSLVAAAVAASLSFTLTPALAQSSSSTDKGNKAQQKAEQRQAKVADDAWQRTHRATKIVGTEVRNAQGQKIGTVKDLVLEDAQSGRISQVVVAVGGVLGMGDKLFSVPYNQMQMAPDGKHVVLSNTNDLAQTFDEKHWPEAANQSKSATSSTSPSASSSSMPSPSASTSTPSPSASSASTSTPSPSSASASSGSTTSSSGTTSTPDTGSTSASSTPESSASSMSSP